MKIVHSALTIVYHVLDIFICIFNFSWDALSQIFVQYLEIILLQLRLCSMLNKVADLCLAGLPNMGG